MDSFRFRDIVCSVARWPDDSKPHEGFRDGWRAACSVILGRLDQALQQVAHDISAEQLPHSGTAREAVSFTMPPARQVLHLAHAEDVPEPRLLTPGQIVQMPAARMPEWMQYDHERDELVIHGKRFALKLFSADGLFAEAGYCLEIVRGRDEVVTVRDIGERHWLEEVGAERARAGVQEVSAGFDDIAFDGQPEAWSEKPFARIAWHQDDGDPDAGEPGRSGWTLASDQAGTVIEDLARAEEFGSVQGKEGFAWQLMMARKVDQANAALAAALAPLSQAARDLLAERRRQVEVEGWTTEHDDEHEPGELAAAAAAYALAAADLQHPMSQGDGGYVAGNPPDAWPWAFDWWKPADARRNLEKAVALGLAAMEQIDRAKGASKAGQ